MGHRYPRDTSRASGSRVWGFVPPASCNNMRGNLFVSPSLRRRAFLIPWKEVISVIKVRILDCCELCDGSLSVQPFLNDTDLVFCGIFLTSLSSDVFYCFFDWVFFCHCAPLGLEQLWAEKVSLILSPFLSHSVWHAISGKNIEPAKWYLLLLISP